jgi:hypothetical protein
MEFYMIQNITFLDDKTTMNKFSRNNLIRIFLLLFSLQLPSLAPIFKYLHFDMNFLIPFYAIAIIIFYSMLFSTSLRFLYFQKILNSPLTLIFLFIFLLLLNAVLYRHQLALQSIGRGTDAGDALTFTAYNLFHGHFPYSHLTYLGNFVSAGPGLFILALPFTYIGAYGILIPLLIILSALIIKNLTGSFLYANLYMLCLLTSPSFIQAIAQGNDYLIIGLTYSLITVTLFNYWGKNWLYNLCFIVCIGLLATVRLNFFYLAPLLGAFIWKRDKNAGIYFACTGLFITLLIHAGFYMWNPSHYMPLHVINDYAGYTTGNDYGLGILISFCAIIGMLTIFFLKNTLESWLFFLWLCLTTPLLIGGFFCLIHQHWDIQGIGFGYITLTAPILIMWITINFKKEFITIKSD